MKFAYTLDENDFLNHQLYLASKSERIKKNRLKNHFWVVAAFLSMTLLFYIKNDKGLLWYFAGAALIAGVFYPLYSRRLYRRHYQKFIRENYSHKIAKEFVLHLDADRLWSKDELSEGSISLSALSEIVEVPTAFYLKTAASVALLLPKNQLSNLSDVRAELESVAKRYAIPYQQELTWQWK
jgi:hypothetical protein